jgi:hypothetical protein
MGWGSRSEVVSLAYAKPSDYSQYCKGKKTTKSVQERERERKK